ncbi:hypothetical protein PANO111632_02365 [Paracoccus nototheniae]|uniref:Uncharacterized protein n=1 Tax=Paracoccus nototheniae TaxID=2489002 RepID=A0ABW4DXW9_9RHOB|nr:hypothetical protein [Paracoccus nototheniae]
MDYPTATLRQITDAVARTRGNQDPARLYSRARTMRDRGLILSSAATSQGKEISYSPADIAAAVVAISLSLDGGSSGQVSAINSKLRPIGNTQGTFAYEKNVQRVSDGVQIFIRLDIYTHPWAFTDAKMGSFEEVGLTERFEWFDDWNHANVISQTVLLPVTTLVRPVLSILAGQEA